MPFLCEILGALCIVTVALDAFQTIILPRRPKSRFRITRLFFVVTWRPWVALGARFSRRVRDQFHSIFGPLSMLLLLMVWAGLLVIGFGLIYFGLGAGAFHDAMNPAVGLPERMRTALYVSGTTMFTLGLGDVTPQQNVARFLLVVQSGVGLGLVAVVIGYVPVLYQAFSRREVSVAMLDGRAGSPPTAAELLLRHGYDGGDVPLLALLVEWERWSAELLESHVSYPVLCYYRSQHDNQNWLTALVCILDTCALLVTVVEGEASRQAQLTFAMARHALFDLGHIFSLARKLGVSHVHADRLPAPDFSKLCHALHETGMHLCADETTRHRLAELRAMYESQAWLLADYLELNMPQWIAPPKEDSWTRIAGLMPESSKRRLGLHGSSLALQDLADGEHD